MKITPVAPIPNLNRQLPKKELTISGCCDRVDITRGTKQLMFGIHWFDVTVCYCIYCGSVKASSNIQERKNVK
tara:strand:- start:121 stop:339 length:219 start_codon:yes stop_codon:yes gene_type:complete